MFTGFVFRLGFFQLDFLSQKTQASARLTKKSKVLYMYPGTRYCQNFTTTSIDGIHTYQLAVPGQSKWLWSFGNTWYPGTSFYLERKHQGRIDPKVHTVHDMYVANGLQSIGNNFTQAMFWRKIHVQYVVLVVHSTKYVVEENPSEYNLTVDINFFFIIPTVPYIHIHTWHTYTYIHEGQD